MNKSKNSRSYGTVCCVPLCKNNTKSSREVSFHYFPRDVDLKKEWIRRVRRIGSQGKFSKWSPNKNHRICGAHFNASGKKKYEDKLPCFFPNKTYNNNILASSSKPATSVKVSEDLHNQIIYPVQFDDSSPSFVPLPAEDIDLDLGSNVVIDHSRTMNAIPMNLPSRAASDISECSSLHDMHFHDYAFIGEAESIISKLKETLDGCISSNEIFKSKNTTLKEEVKQLKKELSALKTKNKLIETEMNIVKSKALPAPKEFSLKSIMDDDKKIRFYTGFANKGRLQIFLDFIIEAYNDNKTKPNCSIGRPKALNIEDEIFLVLCRLRLGLLESDLANRFQISVTTINRIWQFWVNFIAALMVQMPIWPSRQTIDRFMPPEFKELYPTTRIILDCTELFIENPSEFRVQSDTYSSYKSHNTAKGLIGITPNGFVSLVSDLAPGRVSDKVVTNNSGLYSRLEDGDSVMADRGFLIEDSLEEIGVKLNIPPFLKGKPQLSVADEQMTRDIAKLRIHVERVIRGVKQFRILKYVFPNSMADKLDPIWKICCHLINFIDEPLLQRNDNSTEASGQ